MDAVSLEELLESLVEELRALETTRPAELAVPAHLVEAGTQILEGHDITVTGLAAGSDDDLFIVWSPEMLTAYWTPGLSTPQLETYQALRSDGMVPDQALATLEALQIPAPQQRRRWNQ